MFIHFLWLCSSHSYPHLISPSQLSEHFTLAVSLDDKLNCVIGDWEAESALDLQWISILKKATHCTTPDVWWFAQWDVRDKSKEAETAQAEKSVIRLNHQKFVCTIHQYLAKTLQNIVKEHYKSYTNMCRLILCPMKHFLTLCRCWMMMDLCEFMIS